MRKRAGFARALVMEPDIVIFDEPDSGLDPVRTALLCELIQEMHSIYGGTYIVVTHDIASARQIGEYIALLWRGRIVEAGDARADVLLRERVRAPVPQRVRRGPADDGLTRGRLQSVSIICEHTFVWSSACICPASSCVAAARREGSRALAGLGAGRRWRWPRARAGAGLVLGQVQRAWERSRGGRGCGVARGMVLGEALARCPELVLVPPDPVKVAETWEGAMRRPGIDRRRGRAGAAGARVLPGGRAAWPARHAATSGARRGAARARGRRPPRIGGGAHALLRAGGRPGGALAQAADAGGRRKPGAGSRGRPVELLGYREQTAALVEPLTRLGVRTLGEL